MSDRELTITAGGAFAIAEPVPLPVMLKDPFLADENSDQRCLGVATDVEEAKDMARAAGSKLRLQAHIVGLSVQLNGETFPGYVVLSKESP